MPAARFDEYRRPGIRIRQQLRAIAALEFRPSPGVVIEPTPQLGAWRSVLQPRIQFEGRFRHPARPQPLDQKAGAVGSGLRLVNALDLNHRFTRSSHEVTAVPGSNEPVRWLRHPPPIALGADAVSRRSITLRPALRSSSDAACIHTRPCPSSERCTPSSCPAPSRQSRTRQIAAWPLLRAYAQEKFPKAGVTFADVHNAVIFAVTGDRDSSARLAEELRAAIGKQWAADIAEPIARGFEAFANKDWSGAIDAMEPVSASLVRIGGSRAQRDLVENTLLAAYLRGGRAEQAKALLARRDVRRPSVPLAGL